MSANPENNAEQYIEQCPPEAREKLQQMRKAIGEAAPNSVERTDYFQMPGYSYGGYQYSGMFAWFSYKKPYLRLHIRPSVIQNHESELKGYKTTKAIVSFPVSEELPLPLIKKLVTDSLELMQSKAEDN